MIKATKEKKFMGIFHRHTFKIIGTSFTPPQQGLTEMSGGSTSLARTVLEGVTNIYLQCNCGAIKTERVFGEAKLIK